MAYQHCPECGCRLRVILSLNDGEKKPHIRFCPYCGIRLKTVWNPDRMGWTVTTAKE